MSCGGQFCLLWCGIFPHLWHLSCVLDRDTGGFLSCNWGFGFPLLFGLNFNRGLVFFPLEWTASIVFAELFPRNSLLISDCCFLTASL